ncbi:hypothetical protein [Marinoscillum sp. MHG1-6]|uniref:hypothetical protein n=1 Tax=Marinoscillum sp. MHG1-6 TaxID=2959627 RepID=UPI0021578E79|nr:hypothetical protein [Marinoscillum sp. MHG1-6]
MSFFDQVYQKLFPRKSRGVILHEVLKRSHNYSDHYQLWRDSELSNTLLNEISESLRLKEQGIVISPDVHQFRGDYSNGIAISYHEDIEKDHFQFLFDLLAERVKELGYKISVSDNLVTEKEGIIESKEKHYLKSRLSNERPIDQKYGNIIIEYIKINDQPSFIRLMALAYNDRLYKDPENFQELAAYLFNTEKNQ